MVSSANSDCINRLSSIILRQSVYFLAWDISYGLPLGFEHLHHKGTMFSEDTPRRFAEPLPPEPMIPYSAFH